MQPKGTALAVAAAAGATAGSRNLRRRLPAVADSPSSPYAVGPVRQASDGERARVEALVKHHPEFERLGHEPLLQVAAAYLDDNDLRLRGELRGAGVPIGYRRPQSDDVNPPWSDEAGGVTVGFGLFWVGAVILGAGLAVPYSAHVGGQIASTAAIVVGAALIGFSFGEGDDSL